MKNNETPASCSNCPAVLQLSVPAVCVAQGHLPVALRHLWVAEGLFWKDETQLCIAEGRDPRPHDPNNQPEVLGSGVWGACGVRSARGTSNTPGARRQGPPVKVAHVSVTANQHFE